MDDRRAALSPQPQYRCPGQSYTIDRAVHLARLASFYPGCLRCEHRHDAGGLSPLQLRSWQQLERRAPLGPRPSGEGLEGAASGDIDAAVVAQLAAALAAALWQSRDAATQAPRVLVGTDGHWTTADFVPAACRALQLGGCRALETGAVTSACLAAAAGHLRAEAALWIGNSRGTPHATSIKLWHTAGRPSSSPGRLDLVLDCYPATPVRPSRGGGGTQRFAAEEIYLPKLSGLFHGLRPLVFVLDTTCHPLVRYWDQLNAQSACRMVPLRPPTAAGHPAATDRPRPDALAREVLAEQAHFGIWIDGDGEACQLIDQRGECVAPERLFSLLAGYACRRQSAAAVVLQRSAGPDQQPAAEHFAGRVFHADATRQAMCERMETTGALVGCGEGGRYWFSGPPPAPDALLCLCLLISILSESDHALSEVLDAARIAG